VIVGDKKQLLQTFTTVNLFNLRP